MKAYYDLQYLDSINKQDYQQEVQKDYFSSKQLKVETFKNAVILPYQADQENQKTAGGGILDNQGNYVINSAQRIVGKEMNHGYSYDAYRKEKKTVIWFGAFHTHWGHFLTEMISRCWYLLRHTPEQEPIYLAYIRKTDSSPTGIQGNYLEFLELLGIRPEQILEVSTPTQFTTVILPESSCRAGTFFTKEYVEIFDYIKHSANANIKVYPKLYFTRLKGRESKNTEMGEKEICRVFKKNGYHIMAPENHTLKEQITYLKSCEQLVTISGTLPHNLLFAQEGLSLVIINRTRGVNPYQTLINQAKGAHITYIDAYIALLPTFSNGPFLMNCNHNLLAYAQSNHLCKIKKKKHSVRLHLQLAWYFYCYLDQMTGETVRHWNLSDQYGDYFMNTYAFYRDRIPTYDQKTVRRIRKVLYLIGRMFE